MPKGAALITGASSGIGAELAKLCAAGGYGLILVARNGERLGELAGSLAKAHGIEARALVADLADPAAPQSIFERTRRDTVEILINNAGFGLRGPFAETDWPAESRLIQVNVTALVQLTKLFLPEMLGRRSGRILNVASTAAFVPGPLMAMYYASKAFVLSFYESVANENAMAGCRLPERGHRCDPHGVVSGADAHRVLRGCRDRGFQTFQGLQHGRGRGGAHRLPGHDGGQDRGDRGSAQSLDDAGRAPGAAQPAGGRHAAIEFERIRFHAGTL